MVPATALSAIVDDVKVKNSVHNTSTFGQEVEFFAVLDPAPAALAIITHECCTLGLVSKTPGSNRSRFPPGYTNVLDGNTLCEISYPVNGRKHAKLMPIVSSHQQSAYRVLVDSGFSGIREADGFVSDVEPGAHSDYQHIRDGSRG